MGLRQHIAALAIAVVSAIHAAALAAAPERANPYEASTSDETKRAAIRALPLANIPAPQRARVESALSNVSLFRRLPIRVVDCDPEMYLFLMRNPDVVVNIWQVLGVTQLESRRIGEGKFEIADNAGTTGTVEVLYQSHDWNIALAEGRYEGPLSLRPVKGRCLMVFRTGYVREPDGRYYVTTRLDSFLTINQGPAELVAKVLHPMVGKIADNNFSQSVGFLGSMSRTAELNPGGVQRLAARLNRVSPEARQQLATIAQRIGNDYATLQQTAPERPTTSQTGRAEPPVTVAAEAAGEAEVSSQGTIVAERIDIPHSR
jgi:hypothetical protein